MKNNDIRILNNSVFLREVLPGSREEEIVVDELRNIFIEVIDWFKTIDTPTMAWFEKKCVIESKNNIYDCRALPYTHSFEVEGYPVEAFLKNNRVFLTNGREYSIVFIEFPPEIDLVKYIVLESSKHDFVEAVVFYDKEPNTYRLCVVTGDWRYSLYTGSPPPIPVLVVSRETFTKIFENPGLLRISVETIIDKNTRSKTLIMGINGRSEREIHLTAHHDHWFTGFSDNLVGLETLYRVARFLKRRNNPYSILLISFSSEELGGLNYASWYWAWGSRYLLKTLNEKNLLDKVVVDMNIDCLLDFPFEIYSNPALKHCISRLINSDVKYAGFDNVDFDSFSYTLFGIPALTITSINTMRDIYHTNRDDGRSFNYKVLDRVVDTVLKILECVETNSVRYDLVVDHIMSNLGSDIPIELKNFVTKLAYLNKLVENEEEVVRYVTRLLTNVTYTPGLKYLFLADLLSEFVALKRIINEAEQYVGIDIDLMNYDYLIISFKLTKYDMSETLETLRRIISNRVEYYNYVFEREVAGFLRKKIKFLLN